MKKNVALLAICQAMLMTSSSLLIATSALVGFELASDKAWATVPLGLQFIAVTLVTIPASLLMKRVGRRNGFMIGAALGIVGASICVHAIFARSFLGFSVGAFCLGAFNAFGQYYRFAAADVVSDEYRSRAISLVLAGGVMAAFFGPNLANWTRDLFASSAFAASYASLIGLYVVTILVLLWVSVPPPGDEERVGLSRPLSEIARQPTFLIAVMSAMIGYAVMNLVMSSTPLAMHHHGYNFGDTAFVIQWHVVGMFAPSFVTGHLIRRFGISTIMLSGAVLLASAVAVNLSGASLLNFWVGLLLLGVGWNFSFVGATTLLTEAYRPAEKAKTQGLNDLCVFAMVSITALSSGALHHTVGWEMVNVGVLPWIGISAAAAFWLRARRVPVAA